MNNDYLSSISNFDLFRLILEKFGIEVKDENDIAGAWQVVEKMSETWEFSLNYQDNKYKFLLWKPEWVTSNLYQARECKEGVSNTVPLAICRAALKVMEMVDVV